MIEWPNLTKICQESIIVCFIEGSPESNRSKLVEDGRVDILIISRLGLGKIAKSLPAKNNGKKLSVGYLLKFGSNQHSSKLGEVFNVSI